MRNALQQVQMVMPLILLTYLLLATSQSPEPSWQGMARICRLSERHRYGTGEGCRGGVARLEDG